MEANNLKVGDKVIIHCKDTPDGYGYVAGVVNDKTIEDFKNYMKGSKL